MYARLQLASTSAERVLREPALFVLAILLMISFSMFPRGFMPARTASGGFTIVLCSASGLKAKTVDVPAQTPRRHIGSTNCDVVGAAAAVLPPALGLPSPPTGLGLLSLWSVRAFLLGFTSAFDPNAPPTAPPLLTL